MTLSATALLAGPGPLGPINRPARELTTHEVQPAEVLKCDRMAVNRNPKLGGPTVFACNNAIKDTLACRIACR